MFTFTTPKTNHTMKELESELLEFIAGDYNINDHVDIVEERTKFDLEINTGPDGGGATLEIIVTCDMGTEEGGEPDEILPTYQNKHIFIKSFCFYNMHSQELRVTNAFNNRVEGLLNEQLYD